MSTPEAKSIFESESHTAQTPEVVSKLIRFALSQLSADNAHHEFEHLCRHLARRRICSNIIPATGPVSGGGDKGADFETLPIQSGFGKSGYWHLVATGKVLFACTIEQNLKRKLRADVRAAVEFGEPLERMYFFYNQSIKVGDRNKFKDEALRQHGIKLEIIDGNAIAEFLADPEILWIAERFLSLPSEVSLPTRGVPSWYAPLVNISDVGMALNSDTFYQLKAALRYATARPDHHSDVPKLIDRVRLFRAHRSRVLARKAFYEEFVAMLRGLNAAEGYEDQLIEYLSCITELDNAPELEDAAVILGYMNGACARGILKIERQIALKFKDELLTKLNSLITTSPSFVNCGLLFTKGYVLLNAWLLESDPKHQSTARNQAAEDAIKIWHALLKYSQKVPSFPVERLSAVANFLFPLIMSDKFAAFVKKLDAITAERAGTQRVAEEHLTRATGLLDSKDYLRALREFHEALFSSHSLESQSTAIAVCAQLATLYEHLGLYHAAKYYGLAAAFAALRFPEDELRRLSALGLAVAARADYASGASLLFFATYRAFLAIANEFSIAGRESFRKQEWAKVDFYAMLLTRAAKVIDGDCYLRCRKLLEQVDADDIYAAHEESTETMFAGLDVPALNVRYAEEGIAAPFSDYGPVRITSWKQLGVNWHVEWPSAYESEKYGEALCAVLQIVFAALAGTEFSIIAADVSIVLDTAHTGEMRVRQKPDNETLRFSVSVDPINGMPVEHQLSAAYYILATSSAIASGDFKRRFEEEFKRGLPDKVGVYVSPPEAFRQFYLQEEYKDLHGNDRVGNVTKPQVVRTWAGISEMTELHPQFNELKALEVIENRYRRIREMVPFTLHHLSSDPVFREVLLKLRNSGWKDWHILLGVVNVRLTYLQNARADGHRKHPEALLEREKIDDPHTPTSFFDEERIRTCLTISHISTLKNLGFRMDQMTPNFRGIDAFLKRFRYWELDVPHQDPFLGG